MPVAPGDWWVRPPTTRLGTLSARTFPVAALLLVVLAVHTRAALAGFAVALIAGAVIVLAFWRAAGIADARLQAAAAPGTLFTPLAAGGRVRAGRLRGSTSDDDAPG
jgi:hypothetical protein